MKTDKNLKDRNFFFVLTTDLSQFSAISAPSQFPPPDILERTYQRKKMILIRPPQEGQIRGSTS